MITRKMLVQLIADRLGGLKPDKRVARYSKHFAEPFQSVWLAMDQADASGLPLYEAMLAALANNPERDHFLAEISYARKGGKYGNYLSLEEMGVDLPPIQWLWKGWIPLGMLTLMGAAPGVGKSSLVLDLARRVIHQHAWPDGQPMSTDRKNVIYVDAEGVPQLINERAIQWEMNRRHLYLMEPESDDILDFSQVRYKDQLTEMTAQLEPGLVIIDSMSSISSKGENSVEDVRMLMSYFSALTRTYECGLVMIHHLRKQTNAGGQMQLFDMSMDDFRGSSHITAIARSVIGVSVVQTSSIADRNGPRRVEIVKTNLGPYPEALGFGLKQGANGGMVLLWDETAPKAFKEPTQLDQCVEWLEDFLKIDMEKKPAKPKEVITAAVEEGFSRALVFKARKELRAHIKNTEGRKSNQNCWQWSDEIVDYTHQDEGEDET